MGRGGDVAMVRVGIPGDKQEGQAATGSERLGERLGERVRALAVAEGF